MRRLSAARGATFDRLWLRGMTAHHRGAVDMADEEIAGGKNADAVALARDIRSSQTEQITVMRRLLATP